jgi:thioredoxin 1
MSKLPYVTEESFEEEVTTPGGPVLVDFTATWCAPCKMLEPIVEQLAEEWQGKVKIVKLDVDQNPNLAMQYQVMGVPTLMLFVSGTERERLTGFQTREKLVARLSPHL